MPASDRRPRPERRALLVDAALVLLLSAAGVLIAACRGRAHSGFDLGALFVPNLSWWWSRPRLGGGWNPWVFGGMPANADPELGQLHPMGLVYALASPFGAAAIEAALTPGLGGVGLLVYLRRIGVARAGAIVGALSFALGGFMAGHAVHPPLIRTAAAVPWVLAAIEALDGPALVAGVGAGLALVIAGGHPQTIVYALVPLVGYALAFGRVRERGRAAALLLGGLLAAGATAGMWLPAIEFVGRSTRWSLGTLGALDYLRPTTLRLLVVPFAFGGGVGPLYGTAVEYVPGCSVIACTSYPGMLVWLLVLAGLPLLLATARGRFWISMALFALVFAGGAFEAALGLRGVRGPSRMLLWWNLAVAVLAGIAWPAAGERRAGRWVAAVPLIAALGWSAAAGPVGARAALGSASVLAATLGALALGDRRGWLPVAVLAADLVLLAVSLPVARPARPLADEYADLAAARRVLADEAPDDHGLGRALAIPLLLDADWAPFARVPLLQGYNPLVPRRVVEMLGLARAQSERGFVVDPSLVAPGAHALDVLRTRLLLLPTAGGGLFRAFEDAMRADPERWRALGERIPGWHAWLNRRAAPLAWLVHRVRVVSDDVALRLLAGAAPGDGFDPRTEALAADAIGGVEAAADPAPVELLAFDEDVIRLRATAAAGALLVVGEAAYPGWRACVDGRDVPVHTVDAGLRGVVVPAGRHDVTLAYAPLPARAGLVASVASGLVLAGFGLVGVRRARAGRRSGVR